MLELAHRGYEYQDLICAIQAIDLMLGSVASVEIDHKRFVGDRFDDLHLRWPDGQSEHLQFKRREAADLPFPIETFTSDRRQCLLTELVLSTVPEPLATYRLVVTDSPPLDPKLVSALHAPVPDPGPFIPGASTQRFRLNCDILWPEGSPVVQDARRTATSEVWIGVRNGKITRQQLQLFCRHFILETTAPVGSFDIRSPGPAETILIRRLQEDIGAGVFPNQDRAPEDVAELLLGTIRAARTRAITLSAGEIFRRTRLRCDYGTAKPVQPIVPSMEVNRRGIISEIVDQIGHISLEGGHLVLLGPPGQGKSWACSRLAEALQAQNVMTAIHYCYINEDDSERDRRARAEVVFGSLIHQLELQDSQLTGGQRPALAATPDRLRDMLVATCATPGRRVAVFVDGLDHVTRVIGSTRGRNDPSIHLAQGLANFRMPAGSVMVVACQPGAHVSPLSRAGAAVIDLPPWTEAEIQGLATGLEVVRLSDSFTERTSSTSLPVADEAVAETLVTVVTKRSGGNPLQATYILREIQGLCKKMSIHSALLQIPDFGGSLERYYQRLTEAATDFLWLPEALSLMDFSVTRDELREIFPAQARQLDHYLSALAPVLSEKLGSGGIRIYHESFARFLLSSIDKANEVPAIVQPIITWLRSRGEFEDSRAFRSTLSMLARANRDLDIVSRANAGYLREAVSKGFCTQDIVHNLAVMASSAGKIGDWRALARCLELARAAHTFESERLELVAKHAAVPQFVLGKRKFEDRLLFEGRTVLPYRAGLLYCASLDGIGDQAPWTEYLETYKRGRAADNTVYVDEDDMVELSYLLGVLRTVRFEKIGPMRIAGWLTTLLSQSEVTVRGVLLNQSRRCIDVLLRVLRLGEVARVLLNITQPSLRSVVMLTFAEELSKRSRTSAARRWATYALETGLPAGHMPILMRLGISVTGCKKLRSTLVALIEEIQIIDNVRFYPEKFRQWLDLVTMSAARAPSLLHEVEPLTHKRGWYHRWLRYTIEVARLFVRRYHQHEKNVSAQAVAAFRLMQDDLTSSADVPSPMLFSLREEIQESIRRGLTLVEDSDWEAALQALATISDSLQDVSARSLHPLPPNSIRSLALEFCNTSRVMVSLDILGENFGNGHTDFYAEHAEGELLLAGIARLGEDPAKVRFFWERAGEFLIAYGFRKDMTIFDLLDSATALIRSNTPGILARLAELQTLCLRVVNHDDQDETPYGIDLWWDLVGTADPAGTVSLLCESRMDSTPLIDPEHFERAVRSIYRENAEKVDLVLAGCLRLVVDSSVDATDARLLSRLAEGFSYAANPRALLSPIVARLEQSELDEFSASRLDSEGLQGLVDASRTLRCGVLKPQRHRTDSSLSELARKDLIDVIGESVLPELGFSRIQVEEGIRIWSERPFWNRRSRGDVERFANRLGWSLLHLNSEDAEGALFCLCLFADALDGEEAAPVLSDLGTGFARHGATSLAVLSYVLAFTRSKGGSGWLNFGREEDVQWFISAVRLDRSLAFRTLADEALRLFHTWRYQIPGTTRALVHLFCALHHAGLDTTTGLDVWDAARDVIAVRLPRTGKKDDPILPYGNVESNSYNAEGLDSVFATMLCAFVLHPSRDKRRQALWAITLLFDSKKDVAVDGVLRILSSASEYSALSWVLQVAERAMPGLTSELKSRIAQGAKKLVQHPGLIVRTLARRLVAGDGCNSEPVPIIECGDEFLTDEAFSEESRAGNLLQVIARGEIERAERLSPGFASVAMRRLERLLGQQAGEIARQQRNSLCAHEAGLPELILFPEACVQRALQDVAGEAPMAMARRDCVLPDRQSQEQGLFEAVREDISWCLRAEACRVPFSALPSDYLGNRHETWQGLKKLENGKVSVSDAQNATVVDTYGGDFTGWRTLGVVETRVCRIREMNPERIMLFSWRTIALTDLHGRLQSSHIFNRSDLGGWVGCSHCVTSGNSQSLRYGTLTSLTADRLGRLWYVFGLRASILVPELSLVEFLGLRAYDNGSMQLHDDRGVALVLRVWRSASTIAGRVLEPEFWGMDVLLRPDLYQRLMDEFGIRLKWIGLTIN